MSFSIRAVLSAILVLTLPHVGTANEPGPRRESENPLAALEPLIGEWILRVIRGGQELSEVTLARFFGVHVWVLPSVLVLLLVVHLYLVIRNGISAPPQRDE